MSRVDFLKEQILPIVLTFVVCAVLVFVLLLTILGLNHFTATDIVIRLRWVDILVGMTVYLKTSIDFAVYIGRLMDRFPGWIGRVAIEIGTALGNALGTIIVLIIWSFFKEVHWLLAIMILVAALVLFRLAEDSLEHVKPESGKTDTFFLKIVHWIEKGLKLVNGLFEPVLRFVIPKREINSEGGKSFWSLFGLAFGIPFILGLDDFAGYVPLFNIVNVFGFGTGVLLGHMILNIFLYLSPTRTIKIVKNSVVSFIGSIAFILLGIWGLTEAFHLLFKG